MKNIVDGNRLIELATEQEDKIAFYEKSLKDTRVVSKAFLIKIMSEWHPRSGEITLAKFLMGLEDNFSLSMTESEVE